jgi:hypothetical protein
MKVAQKNGTDIYLSNSSWNFNWLDFYPTEGQSIVMAVVW